MRTSNKIPAAIGAAVLLGSIAAAAPAQAGGGGGNIATSTGACSMGSIWTMKAKPVVGGIETEFSVDTARARQPWTVRITNNKALVFSGNRVTNKVSRSFSITRLAADKAGADRLVGHATNAKTGEVCKGVLRTG